MSPISSSMTSSDCVRAILSGAELLHILKWSCSRRFSVFVFSVGCFCVLVQTSSPCTSFPVGRLISVICPSTVVPSASLITALQSCDGVQPWEYKMGSRHNPEGFLCRVRETKAVGACPYWLAGLFRSSIFRIKEKNNLLYVTVVKAEL